MASSIAPYETSGVARLPDVIDRLFRDSLVFPPFEEMANGMRMRSNLLETDNAYFVQLFLPGIKNLDTVYLQVSGNQMTFKAECEIPVIEDAKYLWRGFGSEKFSETFTLPSEVDGENAEAFYEKGILTITLPKAAHARPHPIKVQTFK